MTVAEDYLKEIKDLREQCVNSLKQRALNNLEQAALLEVQAIQQFRTKLKTANENYREAIKNARIQ